MEGERPQPEQHDEHQRNDAAARSGDLARLADANQEATFADADARRAAVPGILSGEVGPKGRVSSSLRGLSRAERATYGEVPRGSVAPGGGRYLLLPMLAIGVGLLALVALIAWAVWR